MISKLGGFRERCGMVATITSIVPAGYVWDPRGFTASRDCWLLTSLCLAMWLFRIFTRKRMEAWERRRQEGQGPDVR